MYVIKLLMVSGAPGQTGVYVALPAEDQSRSGVRNVTIQLQRTEAGRVLVIIHSSRHVVSLTCPPRQVASFVILKFKFLLDVNRCFIWEKPHLWQVIEKLVFNQET